VETKASASLVAARAGAAAKAAAEDRNARRCIMPGNIGRLTRAARALAAFHARRYSLAMNQHDDDAEEALAEAYETGLAAEKRGDRAAVAAAYTEALRLDPEDHCGAAVRLAALGLAPAPEAAPPAYVATLFDQHAEVFDSMLVDQLGYHVPMLLRELFEARGLGPFERLLDLGCGTGLTGESLEDMTAHRTGVDLSEGMLAIADEKEVYQDLFVGDATGFLESAVGQRWDLITATDVLPYLGAVEALFNAAARRLSPGGVLALSTESLSAEACGDRGWTVGPKQRYGHADGYLQAALEAAGLSLLAMERIVVRHDEGAPIPGRLILAQL
jgi:predicted TPR repeat methyltransferase